MQAQIVRLGDEPHTYPIWDPETKAVTGGLILQCVITQPVSSMGRSIAVYIPPEDVVALMNDLKQQAIAVRSKPMEA